MRKLKSEYCLVSDKAGGSKIMENPEQILNFKIEEICPTNLNHTELKIQNIFWCNTELTLSIEEVRCDGDVNEGSHLIILSAKMAGEDLNAHNNEDNANTII